MNDFEQYTKETLNHYPTPVAEERLWGNIAQTLREDKRRPVLFWLWGLGMGILVFSGLAWYYFYEKNTLPAAAQPRTTVIAQNTPENRQTVSEKEASATLPTSGSNEKNAGARAFQHETAGQPAYTSKTHRQNTKNAAQINNNQPGPNATASAEGQEPAAYPLATIQPTPSDGLKPSDGTSPAAVGHHVSPAERMKPSDETRLPTLLRELSAAAKPALPSGPKTGCSNWGKGPAFRPYFGVYGGAQYPMKTLTAKEPEFENIAAERTETETVLEGLAAGGYLGFKHRSGLFAEGGLEYNRINERFDRTTIRTDTIGKIAVIGIIVNAPGDTTFISDSIHILQETRTVKRTFNNYRFLQIPLAVGFQWRPGSNWTLYGKAGVAFNIRFGQKAEIVNLTGVPEKYVSEKPSPGYPFRSQIGIIPFVNAGARYRLTDNLSLFGELRYLHHSSEITAANYPIRQQYKLPGMNVGAHFQF